MNESISLLFTVFGYGSTVPKFSSHLEKWFESIKTTCLRLTVCASATVNYVIGIEQCPHPTRTTCRLTEEALCMPAKPIVHRTTSYYY